VEGDAVRPTFADVLANVRPGRVARIETTREQRRALDDADGRVALDVLRHLLGARPAMPERFPLTEQAAQAVARRLGHPIGQKRARALVGRLEAAGVIVRAGSYRQAYRSSAVRSGFRVVLYAARWGSALRRKRAVGKRPRVKGAPSPRWWEHALFGDYEGLPPPEWKPARVRRSRSRDEESGWPGGAE
jgi:hypothetical protein